LGMVACLAVGISSAGWAQDLKATQRLSDTRIGFDLGGKYSNYTLTITGPNGFHTSASSKSEPPSIDLRSAGTLDDGSYRYQLTAGTEEKVTLRSTLDNGRRGGPDAAVRGVSAVKSVATSGVFHVKGGTIMKFDPAEREPTNKRQ